MDLQHQGSNNRDNTHKYKGVSIYEICYFREKCYKTEWQAMAPKAAPIGIKNERKPL